MDYKEVQWKYYKNRYKLRDYYLNRIINRHISMPLMGKELHPYFYGGKVLHSSDWANKKISELIYSDKPFMVSRFGNTELFNLNCFLEKQLLGKSPENDELTSEWWENLYTLSGFFPKDDIYQERFAKTILESARCTDILGVWNRPMEDYHLKTSMKKTSITALRWLEPWYSDTPWTHALEGKKVLVIHPFEESIRKQFANRERIFPNGLLPDFELDVLKAVQTLGDNNDYGFATWFEALDYMYKEAIQRDFEVAIIGCGAYGMPLAAMLKNSGKKAIHLGGVTQCLFGIKGSRWVNSPIDKKIPMNEYWVYPDDCETPKGSANVEGGCYWK